MVKNCSLGDSRRRFCGRLIRHGSKRKTPMADEARSPTTRRERRAAVEARREAKAAYREALFTALASGWTTRQIADSRKVSVRTIQREIDHAVAERRLDAPDRFVHLQVARLTKALRVADIRLDRGELAAIAPFVKVVAALERYHRPMYPLEPVHAPPADVPLPLPAPPFALTHASSPGEAAE